MITHAVIIFFFSSLVSVSTYADFTVIPSSLDTGSTNLTSTLTIKTTESGTFSWNASSTYGSNLPWFDLHITNGFISQLSFSSIPISIHRERLPESGTYTGFVFVTQGASSKTATVISTLLPGQNGTYPVISADDRAYAGVPYQISSRQSQSWLGNYFWVTNLTTNASVEVQSFLAGPSGEIIFDTPKAISISLISKDEHKRESIDTRKDFQVWNSPPRVNAGGPYYGYNGATVTVVATGFDPAPHEKLVYSWQFNPPYGDFTPLSSSPTATFVITEFQSPYIICVVSDTWTGAAGTYNGPLGGRGIAQIVSTNEPPDIELAFLTNGVWSAWASFHSVSMLRLPGSNITIRARTLKPAGYNGPLYIEWRENPHNPVDNLIAASDTTNEVLTFDILREPGVYHFYAIGYNGPYQSSSADIFIIVPGIRCQVVAQGFQSPVPVWGAYPTLNSANTNAYGIQDDIVTTRSDIDGWLYLDRPVNSDCFVELQRSLNGIEHEISNYTFNTTITPTLIPHPTFEFPVTLYPFAGQLVDEANINNGIPFSSATLIIHNSRIYGQCNKAGGFSFGNLPKSWPIDDTKHATYYLIFNRTGWSSLCVPLSPSLVNFGMVNALYTLKQTNVTITLNGTVRSSGTGLPVGNAHVWFGDVQVTADENGFFTFNNLPLTSTHISQYPTHILLTEADGYAPTRNIYYNTGTGGNINVYIDGGDTYLYGKVVDMVSGSILTNGIIEIPTDPQNTIIAADSLKRTTTASISPSGYFCVRVPGGCQYITLASRGTSQIIPVTRAVTGTQPVGNDILFVPEPAFILPGILLLYFHRRNVFRHK